MHATKSSWVQAVREAVTARGDGFLRTATMQETETLATGDGIREEPTRSSALLRAWLYRDVHVRTQDSVSAFLGYGALPVSTTLLKATVRTSGWQLGSGRLVHAQRSLSLATRDSNQDGFTHANGTVDLPRLRCGTAPGWLTVAGLNGEVSRKCHRLYFPGVGLGKIEALVHELDSSPTRVTWSLKSSVGVDRGGVEVPRADRTVLYVEIPDRATGIGVSGLLNALSVHASAAAGPGFSVELRPGIHFGGSGNEHGSFGTRMASIAAEALLSSDYSSVERAERNLQEKARRFEAGEE
jgi:hypothetical protein